MIDHRKTAFAMALGLAALFTPQNAQAAATSAAVKAAVRKPVTLTGGGTIDLGTILTPVSATFSGTFSITATAAQTGTYCAAGFSCTGTIAAAMFNIQGTSKTNIGLNIPLTVTLTVQNYTGAGTAPTITLTTVNSIAANNATGSYTIQLPNSGTPGLDFYVGGSLTITETTYPGDYAGTINVTADYN